MWKRVTSGDATSPHGRFAVMHDNRVVELAHAMPDAQSAVLFCLTWQACHQERMKHGPHAGQFVARLSARQLADMTGRPQRTVRFALRRLRQRGIVRNLAGVGAKAVHRLELTLGTDSHKIPLS